MNYAIRILRKAFRDDSRSLRNYEEHIRNAAKRGERHSKGCGCIQARRTLKGHVADLQKAIEALEKSRDPMNPQQKTNGA